MLANLPSNAARLISFLFWISVAFAVG